ncbi:MAG: hypothetical protein N4A54_10820 [Peptostreptococcaceae bacterium]|jgi:predicted thioesterase|nr:hypothetical protein [Peptostreptococcaceae bacterium]
MKKFNIEIGKNIVLQKTVMEDDTGSNYGSGKLDTLLATPPILDLIIKASVKLVDNLLDDEYVSVASNISFSHEKATMIGESISVKVEVTKQIGNLIFLDAIAYDEIGIIGRGKHERAIVNEKSLLEKASKRADKLKNVNY